MSEVTDALGSVAGAAASGPLGGIAAAINAAKGIIGEFVTDPNAKLAATQHILDLQNQLQAAQLDALTKQTQSANDAAKGDHYLSGPRAFFCYGFTAMYIFIYTGLGRRIGLPSVEIPSNMNFIFAGIMLGFVGIPSGIEMLKQIVGMPGSNAVKDILAMPGDSSVKMVGFTAGNKS